jgi:hypothetical protein
MWSPGPASSPLIPRATRFGITSRPIDRGSSNTGQRLLAVTSLTTQLLYPDVVVPVSCWFSADGLDGRTGAPSWSKSPTTERRAGTTVGELPGRRFAAERREQPAASRQPRRPVRHKARTAILRRFAADHLGIAVIELAGIQQQAEPPGKIIEPA